MNKISKTNEKKGQSQSAYDDIKNLIISNKLSPGTYISEAAIIEELPYGRTPVREAFIRLSCDGLVNIHPRKGIEVANISPHKLYDIYEIRQFVEPIFIQENFEGLDRATLAEYRDKFSGSKDMIQDVGNDRVEAILHATKVDLDFHLALLATCGNGHYKEMLKSFFDYLSMVRVAVSFNRKRFHDGLSEHDAIIDAILKNDLEATISALRLHLQSSYFSIMREFSLF